MHKSIKVEKKFLGDGYPCFIIAEAGVNHNGSLKNAIKLAKIAKESGADAVKFQLFDKNEQISKYANAAPYQKEKFSSKKMLAIAKNYDFSWENHKKIKNFCNKIKIIYISSCFDNLAVDYLIKNLKGSIIKIASGEITNYPLLDHIAKTKKPVILSTGMSTLNDVDGALKKLKKYNNKKIILLHCVSNYPARLSEVNLKSMIKMRSKFHTLVGFSDHTKGKTSAIAAVSLGACVIEKHFTLNKNLNGPDHSMSLNPKELKDFVQSIRNTELLLGNEKKIVNKSEIKMKKYVRRSIVALKNIKIGEKITRINTCLKRPGTGIDPRRLNELLKKKAKKKISADHIITWSMLKK
jgi:N,N'-diacetyllegionaminate synthase